MDKKSAEVNFFIDKFPNFDNNSIYVSWVPHGNGMEKNSVVIVPVATNDLTIYIDKKYPHKMIHFVKTLDPLLSVNFAIHVLKTGRNGPYEKMEDSTELVFNVYKNTYNGVTNTRENKRIGIAKFIICSSNCYYRTEFLCI